MNRKSALAGLALSAGLLWYAGLGGPAPSAEPAGAPAFGRWGFDLAGMDSGVAPGDDFFRYANGAWLDGTGIPPDRGSTGTFLQLSIRNEERVQAIVAGLESRPDLTDIERKVRDLYRSFVDTGKLEELALTPAAGGLAAIAGLASHEDVARAMASVRMDLNAPFAVRIRVDDKNPDAYAVSVSQSGLGLPDRDYYLLGEPGVVTAREGYRDYIAVMLELGGIEGAKEKAAGILVLETEMAARHWPRADRRDADKTYNPMTLGQLSEFAPQFPWRTFLAEKGIGAPPNGSERRLIVAENTAVPPLAELFAATPVALWRDYLTFHYLDSHAAYLSKRFDDARFAFRGRILGGQDEQLDRAKRAVQYLNRHLGEGVGEIYVAQYFPPEAKAKAEALVANLLAVYRDRIRTRDWMSGDTRAKALEKAMNFTVKIGYPAEWRDYSDLTVEPDDLLGNEARAAEFDWNRELVRLDERVDRGEWAMSPQTVNAYYDSSFNEIVFPAAILQAPFFDPFADDAINYGAIGAVIGHEISHGFDDQGSKYDAAGVLRNWWTEDDRANFDARTAKLAGQFDGYSALEGMNVNGRLTLGENIADLAGLSIAHAAYLLSLDGAAPPVLDGLTGDQRFFLGYAQVWRFKAREAELRRRLLSDPHSPPEFRVTGAVRNVDAWYEAFGIAPGNALYLAPEERVRLW